MLDRRARTILLLRSKLSHADGIRTATGSIRASQTPGFAHIQRYVDCEDCALNGFVSADCETCQGKGRLPAGDRDPYERKVNASPMGEAKERQRQEAHKRDSDIQRIGHELKVAEGLEAPGDSFTAAVERRDALYGSGSYLELDRALEALRSSHPVPAHAVMLRYVYAAVLDTTRVKDGQVLEVKFRSIAEDSPMARLAEWGVSFIVRLMPDRIRVPRSVLVERDRQNGHMEAA